MNFYVTVENGNLPVKNLIGKTLSPRVFLATPNLQVDGT
jgi:hypothetical protein